ncbi:MAG: hypothetical protein ABSD64_02590 [Terriglobales bacterium]|jgi:hypothetical protein
MAQLLTSEPSCKFLEPNCKFAILAIHNVRVNVLSDLILPDKTRVFNSFPFTIEDHWRDWLGTIQFNQLKDCNLSFVRTATEGWPDGQLSIYGGTVDMELLSQVDRVFAMLRLLGTIEYENAFVLAGYVENELPTCRHFGKCEKFKITRGCLPWAFSEEDLHTATALRETYTLLLKNTTDIQKCRLSRGFYALSAAFKQYYASDRLHGFIRALEALILPDRGSTEKQFMSRCALFAGPKSVEQSIRTILQEAYRMRCDIEHMHDWDRSIPTTYANSDREDVALWRTRQMEELASTAYRKILSDKALLPNFHDDATIEAFWKKTEDEIRAAFGNFCDISKLKIVKKYDAFGRADSSESPPELFTDLSQKAKSV